MTLLAKTRAVARLAGLFRSPSAPAEPWNGMYDPAATQDDIFFCFRPLLGRPPNRQE
jgi:hypothetical protein